MHGRPGAQAERSILAGDVAREPDGPCRCVEAGQEPVAGTVDLDPGMHRERARHEFVVPREQVTPARVPDAGHQFGGSEVGGLCPLQDLVDGRGRAAADRFPGQARRT